MKITWLAIVLPRSGIGYPMEVPVEERQQYYSWIKQRGQRLLAEFSTEAKATAAIKLWMAKQPYYDNHQWRRPIPLPSHTSALQTSDRVIRVAR